jgi:hypothetical protein
MVFQECSLVNLVSRCWQSCILYGRPRELHPQVSSCLERILNSPQERDPVFADIEVDIRQAVVSVETLQSNSQTLVPP